jgi:ADP-ribose pyrophosphatase
MVGERHFYFHVEVDLARQGTPLEDGSPLERFAVVTSVPLDAAIELTRRGVIEDAKTEVALRRLAEL